MVLDLIYRKNFARSDTINFLMQIAGMGTESPALYEDCMEPGCIGKSNTNNLPAPTDLTENPHREKKLFCRDATRKSASVVLGGIAVELEPRRPIFEKIFSSSRKKGGADPN